MKTKNLLSVMLGIVLVVVMASFVSAGISLVALVDANNQNSQTITITQGDLFDVETAAVSTNSEQFSSEKLELVGDIVIFSISDSGVYQGYGIYSYSATHTVDSTSFTPGTYTLRFSVVGTNSNTGSDDLTLIVNPQGDTNAPVVSISNPTSGVYISAPSLDYSAVDNEGNLQDCRFSLDSGNSWSSWSACSSSFGVQTPLNNGANTWIVEARDSFSNVGSASVTFTYSPSGDTNAPSVTITSPNSGLYGYEVTQIDFTPVDMEGNLDTCWYSFDGGITNSTPTSCTDSQTNSFTGLTPVNNAINNWTVFASDLAGNVGSAIVIFTVNDTTAPSISPVSPTDGEVLADSQVTLTINTDEDATVVYSLNNAANVTMTANGLQFDSALLNLNDGEDYNVTYYATDWAGNIASLTIDFSIEEITPSNPSSSDDNYFNTEFLNQYNNTAEEPAIDLTSEGCNLNWWQRFINWLSRLFGLEEIYVC